MNLLSNIKIQIKQFLNRKKPCIVMFNDGTYGIREYQQGQYKFLDFTMKNKETGRSFFWDVNSTYFKQGDCKWESLDHVITIFSLRSKAKKEKKKKENGYSIITYEGEKNES